MTAFRLTNRDSGSKGEISVYTSKKMMEDVRHEKIFAEKIFAESGNEKTCSPTKL